MVNNATASSVTLEKVATLLFLIELKQERELLSNAVAAVERLLTEKEVLRAQVRSLGEQPHT